jgi:ATP-dependent DNA helicase RecG
LAERILILLETGPHSKTEISNALGQRAVSGALNQTIRTLLTQNQIEMTLPDTPQSRLQKYKLAALNKK